MWAHTTSGRYQQTKMAQAHTMISALVNHSDTAVIHVRVTRIWKSFNPYDKRLLHTNVILLDQEGDHILAEVRNNQRHTLLKKLDEGGVYIISRVIVVSALQKFRSVNRDLSLKFFHRTEIKETVDTGAIPRYKFELQEFQNLDGLIGRVVSFIDVIGWVVSYGDLETTKKGAQKIDVELLNDRQEQVIVSLWGDKGPEFMAELNKQNGVPIFAVVTGLLAKTYFGSMALSTGDGTRYFFNVDYPPLNELKKAVLGATGKTIDTLSPPNHKPQLRHVESASVLEATIQDILETSLPQGKEFVRYFCRARIVDIVKDDTWYYNSCPTCNRSVILVEGNYRCRACAVPPSTIKQGYKVSVMVEDATGTTTFTLFNKDAELLIGVPIEKIIGEMGEVHLIEEMPVVVANIVGKECEFEVKVTSYNINNRVEDYGVSKVTECSSAHATTEVDSGEGTSAAKKRKMP